MDNAQKAIMIGVGLFITIIIISAVLLIVNLGTGLVDDATANLSSISSSLQNQILQNYDNKLLTGTQVRSAIQQYMTSAEISVVLTSMVDNDTAEIVYCGGARDISGKAFVADPDGLYTIADISGISQGNSMSMSKFSNPDNAEYVNTSRRYNSYIVKLGDTEGAMLGMIFIPESVKAPSGSSLPEVTNTTP